MKFTSAMRLRRIVSWREWVVVNLTRLVNRLEARWFPSPIHQPAVGGKVLMFTRTGRNLGHDVLSVKSIRGGMGMGTIEWSNQWNRPRFKAHSEAIFDQQCIAEIYAAMKGLK